MLFCFRRKKPAIKMPPSPPVVAQAQTETKTKSSNMNTSSQNSTKRRFHNVKNSEYVLPNDEEEGDRLHFQHWIIKSVQGGKNFCAPLEKALERGIDVLDVGTGPGTWVLEMAKDYQSSKFTGIDISDTFPESIKPSNSNFLVANLNEELPFESGSFDYIHMRFLILGLTAQQYEDSFTKIFKLLRPGGWFELGEADVRFAWEGSIWYKFLSTMVAARGLDYTYVDHLNEGIENAGFINVERNVYHNATGPFGGKLGQLSQDDMRQVYHTFKDHLMKPLNLTPDQYDDKVEDELQEYNRRRITAKYIKILAQKP